MNILIHNNNIDYLYKNKEVFVSIYKLLYSKRTKLSSIFLSTQIETAGFSPKRDNRFSSNFSVLRQLPSEQRIDIEGQTAGIKHNN